MAYRITEDEFYKCLKSKKLTVGFFRYTEDPINYPLFLMVSQLAPKYKNTDFVILDWHANSDEYWQREALSYMHVMIMKNDKILWTEFNPSEEKLQAVLEEYGAKKHSK